MTAMTEGATLQGHGERISALENSQQHLATEADLANLQAALTWRLILAVSIATAIVGLRIHTQ